MSIETIPAWMKELEEEDLVFIKKFVLASGSLKEVAKQYQVTYPTVRLRLDRLIQKIQMGGRAGMRSLYLLNQTLCSGRKNRSEHRPGTHS